MVDAAAAATRTGERVAVGVDGQRRRAAGQVRVAERAAGRTRKHGQRHGIDAALVEGARQQPVGVDDVAAAFGFRCQQVPFVKSSDVMWADDQI